MLKYGVSTRSASLHSYLTVCVFKTVQILYIHAVPRYCTHVTHNHAINSKGYNMLQLRWDLPTLCNVKHMSEDTVIMHAKDLGALW